LSRANIVSRGTLFNDLPTGWCCYLLLCSDGSYYCGLASHLPSRLRQHASGRGSSYTKRTRPKALVWFETHVSRPADGWPGRKLEKPNLGAPCVGFTPGAGGRRVT
jgi:putative endonuclease